MAQTSDCVQNMIKAMEARSDMVGVACEALHKMFDKNHPELVVQVRLLPSDKRCSTDIRGLIASTVRTYPVGYRLFNPFTPKFKKYILPAI